MRHIIYREANRNVGQKIHLVWGLPVVLHLLKSSRQQFGSLHLKKKKQIWFVYLLLFSFLFIRSGVNPSRKCSIKAPDKWG